MRQPRCTEELKNRNAELPRLNRTLSLATRQLVQSEKLAALSSLVAGGGGSGLGLHIAHNIAIGLLGGTVEVESVPGQGARFIFRLPLAAPLINASGRAKQP